MNGRAFVPTKHLSQAGATSRDSMLKRNIPYSGGLVFTRRYDMIAACRKRYRVDSTSVTAQSGKFAPTGYIPEPRDAVFAPRCYASGIWRERKSRYIVAASKSNKLAPGGLITYVNQAV